MSLWSRVSNVFRTARLDRELDDEQRFHLESRIDDLVGRGLTRDAATAEAMRRFGSALRAREVSRDVKLATWLESLLKDVRFGVRVLWRDRTVTGAAIVSLGLAIGACTAAFSLVDALMLRPLPVREPHQLVYLTFANFERPDAPDRDSFNYPLFERLRADGRRGVDLFAASYDFRLDATLSDVPGQEERLRVQYVSGDAFTILGLAPAAGRLFSTSDDLRPGQHPVAVLGHAFWQRRFAGAGSAIGRTVTFDGHTFEIVGVAPRGFTGVEPGTFIDVWVPTQMYEAAALSNPGWSWFRVLGRLGPGVEPSQVHGPLQAAFTQSLRQRAESFPPDAPREPLERFLKTPLRIRSAANGPSMLRRDFERPLWILAAIVGLVLLVAGSNVTNLLLARGASREREMSLRLSIGAGRIRLVQQALVESGVLSLAACALALPFAAVVAPAIVAMLAPSDSPAFLDLHIDWRVLTFLVGIGLLATVSLGLAPALRASSVSPIGVLKGSGGRLSARTKALGPLLTLQVTFSVVVLFVSALLLVSFGRLTRVNLGFNPNGVLLVTVEPRTRLDAAEQQRLSERVLDRVRQAPGVERASQSGRALFSGFGWASAIRLPGRPLDIRESHFLEVSDDFFDTLLIPVRDGRTFTRDDARPERPPGVVVNETFARRYFGNDRAVGQTFSRDERTGPLVHHILGVVADAKYRSVRDPAPAIVYVPSRGLGTIYVRTSGEPLGIAPMLERQILGVDPALRVSRVTLQSTLVNNTLLRERLLAMLSGFFAVLALVLVGVGLYGVLSYSVVQRTREIGIRAALGAGRLVVIRTVLAGSALVVAAGTVGGLAGGAYLARFLRSFLYEVAPLDSWSLALPLGALLLTAVAAALVPALRASRVDPADALRFE